MNAMFCDNFFFTGASTLEIPDETVRGGSYMNYLISLENQPLPSDPVGTMSITLNNVVVGSTYDVEVISTGSQVTSGSASSSSVILTVPVYLSGDTKNSLRIKVRRSSPPGPYYQPYETRIDSYVGSTSIFINQISDES